MEGFYTVRYVPALYLGCDCEIELFSNATELALLNFLKFVQEGDGCLDLSDESIEEMKLLKAEFSADVFSEGLYCEAFYFLQNASQRLMDEVKTKLKEVRAEVGGKTMFSIEEAEEAIKKYACYIKHVKKAIDTHQKINSHCTVKVPLAFLFRTGTDSDGYFKQWYKDQTLYSVLQMMSTKSYQSYKELETSCFRAAEVHGVDKYALFVMTQALMTKQLVDIVKGVNRKTMSFELVTDKAIAGLL